MVLTGSKKEGERQDVKRVTRWGVAEMLSKLPRYARRQRRPPETGVYNAEQHRLEEQAGEHLPHNDDVEHCALGVGSPARLQHGTAPILMFLLLLCVMHCSACCVRYRREVAREGGAGDS